jgi:hypothetical protein
MRTSFRRCFGTFVPGLAPVLATALSLSGPAGQGGDSGASSLTGARVAGIVTAADAAAARPVRRAIVTLAGPGGLRGVVTNDGGSFSFEGLAAGRYTLKAAKSGYITSEYGSREPGAPGIPIVLEAGRSISGLTLALPRGAVVAGTIRDARGAPARNVVVFVECTDCSATARALTDPSGAYRTFGLPPGEYVVRATPPTDLMNGARRLEESEVDSAIRDLERRAVLGGEGADAGTQRSASPPDAMTAVPLYRQAIVFYPGTTDRAQATKIRLAAGNERQGVDFSLVLEQEACVDGVVLMPDGSDTLASPVVGSGSDYVRTCPPGRHVAVRRWAWALRCQRLRSERRSDW